MSSVNIRALLLVLKTLKDIYHVLKPLSPIQALISQEIMALGKWLLIAETISSNSSLIYAPDNAPPC
jgi:hypothetical protein